MRQMRPQGVPYIWKGSFLGWFVGFDVPEQEIFVLRWLLWSAQYKIFFFLTLHNFTSFVRIFLSCIPNHGIQGQIDPGSVSASKNLSISKPKKCFSALESMIGDVHISGSGVKKTQKAPDSGSGSATLTKTRIWIRIRVVKPMRIHNTGCNKPEGLGGLSGVPYWIRIRIHIDLKCWIRIRVDTYADPQHW